MAKLRTTLIGSHRWWRVVEAVLLCALCLNRLKHSFCQANASEDRDMHFYAGGIFSGAW